MNEHVQGSFGAVSDPGQFVGDIATGAIAARAVEPTHGEAADGHTHERACLNCGTALIGSHCHSCGQAAHVHKTIAAFFHDLVHGVFHFEGKIWRTLPMLAWHPGRLTREYIDGRRASYVSPIALFLFVVFLTFALFSLASGPVHLKDAGGPHIESKASGKLPDALVSGGGAEANPTVKALNQAWREAKANPDLAVYKLQASAYKYSWLLIPLSVPFVWLLFPLSRRFHLYDHTVFVTYSLCFMLIVLAAITAIATWTSLGWLIAALVLYAPFHMHRQLREAYGLTRLGALWRTLALSWFAVIALMLWAVSVLALSIG